MASKNTHTTVHAVQYYDSKAKTQRTLPPGTDYNSSDFDFDSDALVKSGAVKKFQSAAAKSSTNDGEGGDEFDTILAGTVEEVQATIAAAPRDAEWLKELRKRENGRNGKKRVGVLEAIDGYQAP